MAIRPINLAAKKDNEVKIKPGSVVEYENHGKAMLAIAQSEQKNSWKILNESGAELQMPAARLYLYPAEENLDGKTSQEKLSYLEEVQTKVKAKKEQCDLEEAWELISEQSRTISIKDLTEIIFKTNDLVSHITCRRALLEDIVFFKRKKNEYEPRPESVVKELKVKAKVEREKARVREEIVEAIISRIKSNNKTGLPKSIQKLEQLAAKGKDYTDAKDTLQIVDEVIRRGNLDINGKSDQKTFKLLCQIGHFTKDQNLLLIKTDREAKFPEQSHKEASEINQRFKQIDLSKRKDLRELNCMTIDGEKTKDFDDALSLETTPNGYRLGIHISDVASNIGEGTALEKDILHRATTIYFADEQVSMLPDEITYDYLSLIKDKDRPTLSILLELDKDYQITNTEICTSVINVKHQLSYNTVDGLLYDDTSCVDPKTKKEILELWRISSHFETERLDKGGLTFNRREMLAQIDDNGSIYLASNADDTPARRVVSEFMILANLLFGQFAIKNQIPIVYRSQEEPEIDINTVETDIPEGPARDFYVRSFLKRSEISTTPSLHFGLGLEVYTQVTSPVRRAYDFLTQRQLISFLYSGCPFYSVEELDGLIDRVGANLSEAQQIQRIRNRYWLLKYLAQEKTKELEATVMKVDGKKPIAELDIIFTFYPFNSIERQKGQNQATSKRPGDRIKLRIDEIDARNDRIILNEV